MLLLAKECGELKKENKKLKNYKEMFKKLKKENEI